MSETRVVKTIRPEAFPFQYRCLAEKCSYAAAPMLAESEAYATAGAEAHVRSTGHTVVVESRAVEEPVTA